MNKKLFYILSFTWGLPMTIIGGVVAIVLRVLKCKPIMWKWCLCFRIGSGWGGINLGPVIVVSKTTADSTLDHELGHGIQNCYFGFLMPFVVGIPSLLRATRRTILASKGVKLEPYDAVWYEDQATRLGAKYSK